MARYTSLYQAPRSPLIQGRTRWERPLWQAWLGGMCLAAAVLVSVMWTRTTTQGAIFGLDAALGWSLAGVVAGSGIGSVLARLWGWRHRWLGSALAGVLLGAAMYGVQGWLAVLGRPPIGG